VQANLKLTSHDHITPLLAAFKHKGSFYLMFPWAHGGNLSDIWKIYSTSPNGQESNQRFAKWFSVPWFLDQCWGVADALATTHQRSVAEATGGQYSSGGQLHADIKPENILCFNHGEETEGPFTLKLADFGLTQMVVGPNLDVDRVAHTKTYRPPEHDIEDKVNLKYDVWCLGCLFLEFITWVLLGWTGVTEFRDARLDELDDRKARSSIRIREDVFFKKHIAHSGLLPSVVVRFSYGIERKINRKLSTTHHVIDIQQRSRQIRCKVKDTVLFVCLQLPIVSPWLLTVA
jgi:serine/threonine protein kinase